MSVYFKVIKKFENYKIISKWNKNLRNVIYKELNTKKKNSLGNPRSFIVRFSINKPSAMLVVGK